MSDQCNITILPDDPPVVILPNDSNLTVLPGISDQNATRLQGRNISSTAPTGSQSLVWNATSNVWEPQNQAGGVQNSRLINTTSPLGGGGDLSADRTLQVGSLSGFGTANYVVGVNSAASAWEYKQLRAGTNVTITHNVGSITISSTGGGGGSTRSINSISSDTTAGETSATDYYYLATGSLTITLPDAASNTNLYSIKSIASAGSVVIEGSGTQTIDGSTNAPIIVQYVTLDLISDGSNWVII